MAISSSPSPGGGAPKPRRGRVAGLREAIGVVLPAERYGDHLAILSGTGQNIVGLGIFVVATFGANVLITRTFGGREGAAALGIITLATQFAFLAGAATRFGMDVASVRRVAIDVGKGEPGRARAVMSRAALIAAVASLVVALPAFALAGKVSEAFGRGALATDAFRFAAVAIPFVALSQVYLGGTRGLKIMRHTLSIYWAGQPMAWIVLMVAGWAFQETVGVGVAAYAGSWILATVAAWYVWRRETRGFEPLPAEERETSALLKYGAPRAPAALLSQALFWADYFVLSFFVPTDELGVYAAAVRVGQTLVLFLTAVSYMFSPFVADLHARGERERLDGLYKALTRWVLAGTIPLMLLLLVVPGPVLKLFGGEFDEGQTALRILLVGQLINVSVGSVGFVLIMVGRTGWDLTVYAGSFALDVVVALLLAPKFGAEGAAVAQTITQAVSKAARLYLVWRFVGIQPFNRHYFRLLIPAGVAAAAMAGVHLVLGDTGWPAQIVLTGGVGLAVYAAVFAMSALTPTERAAAGRILRRDAAARS